MLSLNLGVDTKSKLDDVKSQATRSLTQAVIFPCGVPRALWYSGT